MATKKTPKTATVASKTPAKASKTAAKKPATKKSPVPKAPAETKKKKAAKATSSKVASLSLSAKKPLKVPVIPHEEISLRAYFIAERRHKMGWPGDSTTDWDDAVKQLQAEALERPLKKR